MKKHLLSSLIIALLISIAGVLIAPHITLAANKADFDPGYIIDDYTFYNSSTMDANQIQNFLNSKNPNCDYDGTQPASDWGYPDITHAQLAQYFREGSNGFVQDTGFNAPPYRCLTRYTQNTPQMNDGIGYCQSISAGTRTAAQIIYDIARACGINPQTLIVLLEKEQNLVTDNWPLNRQLQNATGFACPDTAPCDPAYEGFFYQVYYGARQFKIYQANPNDYNYRAGLNNNIYWHPDLSRCGSSTVYIQNQATAGLYTYTPYRPNQAALDNLYGLGDSCSSYGNRNFWRIFWDWFGSPQIGEAENAIAARYAEAGVADNLGAATGKVTCGLKDNGCFQFYEKGAIMWSPSTGAWESFGPIRARYSQLGFEGGSLGYPTGPVYCDIKDSGCYQAYQTGYIVGSPTSGWWKSTGAIRARWGQLSFENGTLGYPITNEQCTLKNGGCFQFFQNGAIVGSPASGWWESMGPIRGEWSKWNFESGRLGYPVGALSCTQDSEKCMQPFQGGAIYYSQATGAKQVWGAILGRYFTLGADNSALGDPVTNEQCTLKNGGCFQFFQNGAIVGNPTSGWWESMGPIRGEWEKWNFEGGRLGYPTGALTCAETNDKCTQPFQGGAIYYSQATGAKQVWGAILGRYFALGANTSTLGYPITNEQCTLKNGGCFQFFQNGAIVGSPASGWWESMGPIREKWASLGYENGSLGYPTGPIITQESNMSQAYQNNKKIIYSPDSGAAVQ